MAYIKYRFLQTLRVLYRKVLNPYKDFFVPAENENTKRLVKNFKDSIAVLAKQSDNKNTAHDEWRNCLLRLEDLTMNDNPIRFLQWDVIQDTMFIGNKPYVKKILNELQSASNYSGYWVNSIKDNGIGSPPKLPYLKTSTGCTIVHSYHLHVLEQNTSIKINSYDLIVEFGGGYGCLCNIIFQLGFNKKYLIFDFPHYNYLQRYFLSSNNLKCSEEIGQPLDNEHNIYFYNEIQSLEKNISLTNNNSKKLFIANWSLSEAPISVRTPFEPMLKNFDTILIAFQGKFGEIDNNKYFDELSQRHKTHKFKTVPFEHMPDNYYLIGVRQ